MGILAIRPGLYASGCVGVVSGDLFPGGHVTISCPYCAITGSSVCSFARVNACKRLGIYADVSCDRSFCERVKFGDGCYEVAVMYTNERFAAVGKIEGGGGARGVSGDRDRGSGDSGAAGEPAG
jgi:hypothetical protein